MGLKPLHLIVAPLTVTSKSWACSKNQNSWSLKKNFHALFHVIITNEVPVAILQAFMSLPSHIRKGVSIRRNTALMYSSWLPVISQRIEKTSKKNYVSTLLFLFPSLSVVLSLCDVTKFKFIDIEKTKFKFNFIDFGKVEFKFINTSWTDSNSKFKFNPTLAVSKKKAKTKKQYRVLNKYKVIDDRSTFMSGFSLSMNKVSKMKSLIRFLAVSSILGLAKSSLWSEFLKRWLVFTKKTLTLLTSLWKFWP